MSRVNAAPPDLFGPALAALEQVRSVLVPTMEMIVSATLRMEAPLPMQLDAVRVARKLVTPLLEPLRSMVEPVARADQQLATLERELVALQEKEVD